MTRKYARSAAITKIIRTKAPVALNERKKLITAGAATAAAVNKSHQQCRALRIIEQTFGMIVSRPIHLVATPIDPKSFTFSKSSKK